MNNPAITVLMPAYNAADYIREAIDSVLAQSFADFELLIINDGSTDDTEQIIRSYKDERIVVYNQENKGVIGALNKGLELARAEYIARFDADDVCYPQRLEVQYAFMQKNKDYVLTGSASDYIDMEGNYLFKWDPPAYTHEDLEQVIYEICPIDHPTVMYRKQVAIELGSYPQGAIHFEDHIFWTLFFRKGKVCNLHEPLIKHRFNPGSVTIDEKWRGPVFKEIKYRSIRQGFVTPGDAVALKELLKTQDFKKYKDAAYYSMIGKKYLWNSHNPQKARQHFRKAISIMPGKVEPYILYAFSYLPGSFISFVYNKFKK
jgi:glycosyltransferase involved in cell wall biosynthesis